MIDRQALAACLSLTILKRSLVVAVVIGSLLKAINQGDVILAGHAPVWWKVGLTFLIPLVVASYGAYSVIAKRKD